MPKMCVSKGALSQVVEPFSHNSLKFAKQLEVKAR